MSKWAVFYPELPCQVLVTFLGVVRACAALGTSMGINCCVSGMRVGYDCTGIKSSKPIHTFWWPPMNAGDSIRIQFVSDGA